MGTRDLAFWRRVMAASSGPVIELGCGTGRVTTSGSVVAGRRRKRNPRSFPRIGIDLSAPMLDIARRRLKKLRPAGRPVLLRGDIRSLPIATASVALVIAPYGILQSLVRDDDLARALAEAARVLRPGGRFVADLVPDLPKWTPYRGRVRMRGKGKRGTTVTLVESVRQDRRRGLTIFDETFVERLPDGKLVNHTLGIAELGGATLDNEENYLIKKLCGGGLGMVWIENQARV